MRLRNKKTGKIWHMPRLRQPTVQEDDISFFACISEHGCSRGELFSYKTLDELNEDWEDYEEPLIKDEKVRKAVRAWAEAWNKNKLYKDADNVLSTVDNFVIQFGQTAFIDLEEKKSYTIAELCGEKEE